MKPGICRPRRLLGEGRPVTATAGMARGIHSLNTRWIMLVLGLAGLAMQGQLWLSDSGFIKTSDLRQAVDEQRGAKRCASRSQSRARGGSPQSEERARCR